MISFYLLVRRFVASGFKLCAEEGWNAAAVAKLGHILGKFPGGVLGTNDPKVPDSLTYHLSDIYLDELEKVIEQVHDAQLQNGNEEEEGVEGEEEEEELPLVPTLDLLMPFVDALATAKSKAMYDRIWANVFEPLLEDTLRASARDDEDGFGSMEGMDDEEEEAEDDEEEEEEGGDENSQRNRIPQHR